MEGEENITSVTQMHADNFCCLYGLISFRVTGRIYMLNETSIWHMMNEILV